MMPFSTRTLSLLALLTTTATLAAQAQHIGVGTNTPTERLDVVGGNVKISTTGSRLIFPDGTSQGTAASGTSGSGFILNAPASQQTGSFNLSGAGTLGGNLTTPGAFLRHPTTQGFLELQTGSSSATTPFIDFSETSGTVDYSTRLISQSGALNVYSTASNTALQVNGGMAVDAAGANTGTTANIMRFGAGGNTSGEGIGSKRTGGGNNQFGLDFYTSFANRLHITNNGNVGIGTTAPRGQFDVAGTGDIYLTSNVNNSGTQSLFLPGHVFMAPYGGGTQSFFMARSNVPGGNQGFVFRTNNAGNYHDALTLNPDGGAVFSSPNATPYLMQSTAADVNGVLDLRVPNNPGCPTCGEVVMFRKTDGTLLGSIGSNTNANSVSYNTTSDKRLKEHIGRTRFGLADLLKLEVKDYNFIGAPVAARTTGFLAQDLFKIYPDAVKPGDTGATVINAWAVDYGKLTPLLVQAIQDQQKLIDQQQAELNALKSQNAALQTGSAADHASLLTLQAQMARLLSGEMAPAGTQAHK